jgi:hypothetical protein
MVMLNGAGMLAPQHKHVHRSILETLWQRDAAFLQLIIHVM